MTMGLLFSQNKSHTVKYDADELRERRDLRQRLRGNHSKIKNEPYQTRKSKYGHAEANERCSYSRTKGFTMS